jgi:hypothetical protein
MTWTIWTTAQQTGDVRECVATYANRGHAVSRLRGLRRRSGCTGVWYVIRREGGIR